MKALEGIKVLHLYRTQPSSWAATFLSDYGAEVICIVEPGWLAKMSPQARAFTELTAGMDRNKKSITLNLKHAEGKAVFLKMAEKADVVVDGFRPGVTKRLGIDYDTLSQMNPRLIYAGISGYGKDGPYQNLPGHDLNYMGVAGLLDIFARLKEPQFLPLIPVSDSVVGVYAAIGIFIALVARGKTGEGQFVDVSYVDSILSWALTWHLQDLWNLKALGLRDFPLGGAFPCYGVYEAKDGKYISFSNMEDVFWTNMCKAVGREDFIPHQWDTGKKQQEIFATFRQIFRTRTQQEWFQFFSDKNVCMAHVNSVEEALKDPQVLHRNLVTQVTDKKGRTFTEINIPIKLSKTPGKIVSPDPYFGQDTDEVFLGLGYTKKDMARLREQGVIE